tara:strand:- start:186 stop:539 length:354 start_codon:yes stop_codon:yes gene_type:complete
MFKNERYVMLLDPLKTIKFLSILFLYLFIPFNSHAAFESRDYLLIDKLVKSCYKDAKSCNAALLRINNYQKKASTNKKFSCQTRLLGLEANLIMAMNYKLKRREVKSIIQAVKKHCW